MLENNGDQRDVTLASDILVGEVNLNMVIYS